jgi:hypothetical protein
MQMGTRSGNQGVCSQRRNCLDVCCPEDGEGRAMHRATGPERQGQDRLPAASE